MGGRRRGGEQLRFVLGLTPRAVHTVGGGARELRRQQQQQQQQQAVAVARSGGGALLLSVRLLACMVCSVPGIRLRSESREEQRAGSSY